jgi:hypothetical protein
MCKNYRDLDFTHFVVDRADGTIFGCARENGHTYNFIIRGDGNVRAQQGDQWLEVEPAIAQLIRSRAAGAYGRAPIYRTARLLTE